MKRTLLAFALIMGLSYTALAGDMQNGVAVQSANNEILTFLINLLVLF
jgi:hypothetical protein